MYSLMSRSAIWKFHLGGLKGNVKWAEQVILGNLLD